MTQTAQSYFDVLRGQQYMNLITFRKNGESIKTPVWFVQEDERLYVMTVNNSGKIKRIRNNGRANVGPSDRAGKPLGATVGARARVLPASENKRVDALLTKKYGLQKRAFDVVLNLRRTQRAYVEIIPANEHEHMGDFAAAGA